MNKNLLFKKACLAAAVGLIPVAQGAMADTGVNISGWINEGLTFYDDGDSSDVVQASDNGTTLGSRITFSGSADLPAGLTSSFEVIIEPQSVNTPLIFSNQDRSGAGLGVGGSGGPFDDTLGDTLNTLGSSLYFGGFFGKFTFGLQSMPTDNIAVLGDPSMTLWSSISPVFRGNGFNIRDTAGAGHLAATGGAVWGDFLTCMSTPQLQSFGGIGIDCNGIYRNGVRYDLPTFIDGLSIAAGYANDDIYDVAAKYNTQLASRINTMLSVGYSVNEGPFSLSGVGKLYDSTDLVQVQLGLMDAPTGLFGTFAYQHEEADGAVAGYGDDTDAWWFKVGVKRKITTLGDTSLDFQYGSYNDEYGAVGIVNGVDIDDSEVERIGVALNQYFGSKLIIYGAWEQLDLDVDGSAAAEALFDGGEELDLFTLGLTYFF